MWEWRDLSNWCLYFTDECNFDRAFLSNLTDEWQGSRGVLSNWCLNLTEKCHFERRVSVKLDGPDERPMRTGSPSCKKKSKKHGPVKLVSQRDREQYHFDGMFLSNLTENGRGERRGLAKLVLQIE